MGTGEIALLILIGLASGALGGLLGIGGSIVMIPALTLLLGPNQQLYQAAAMIVNVAVAIPATVRHWRAGAVRVDVVARMLPFGVLMILIGVWASDALDALVLQRVFAVFLIYVIFVNLRRLWRRAPEPMQGEQHATWFPAAVAGSVMGFAAGLLGIGGGILAVPLLQRVCVLPLRQCIACSSAAMCLTSAVGAARKNATLTQHVNVQAETMLELADSLLIALCLAPTAIVGGFIGASLTHALPLDWIRVALVVLLLTGALRMLGLF